MTVRSETIRLNFARVQGREKQEELARVVYYTFVTSFVISN